MTDLFDQIMAAARAALPAWVPREIFDSYVVANRDRLAARLAARSAPPSATRWPAGDPTWLPGDAPAKFPRASSGELGRSRLYFFDYDTGEELNDHPLQGAMYTGGGQMARLRGSWVSDTATMIAGIAFLAGGPPRRFSATPASFLGRRIVVKTWYPGSRKGLAPEWAVLAVGDDSFVPGKHRIPATALGFDLGEFFARQRKGPASRISPATSPASESTAEFAERARAEFGPLPAKAGKRPLAGVRVRARIAPSAANIDYIVSFSLLLASGKDLSLKPVHVYSLEDAETFKETMEGHYDTTDDVVARYTSALAAYEAARVASAVKALTDAQVVMIDRIASAIRCGDNTDGEFYPDGQAERSTARALAKKGLASWDNEVLALTADAVALANASVFEERAHELVVGEHDYHASAGACGRTRS